MSLNISASTEELLKQAPMTAQTYFHAAIRTINERFGETYAREHPELVGAFVAACAQDFHTSMMGLAAQDLCERLSGIDHTIRTHGE